MAITRKGRFLEAARKNNIERVRKYLETGFDANYTSFGGGNALLFAVINGSDAMFDLLTRHGAEATGYFYHSELGASRVETLLHIAAERGHKGLVEKLLELDKYDHTLVNRTDDNGNTALHLAAQEGHADIVRVLLDHGFSPAAKAKSGRTPLGLAFQGGHQRVIEMLSPPPAKPAEKPAPEAPKAAPPASEKWKLVSDKSVAQVSEMEDIGYRITDIFNFASGERIRILHNLKTKADSVETAPFSALPSRAAVEEAFDALERLGGKADEGLLRGLPVARPAPRLAPPKPEGN